MSSRKRYSKSWESVLKESSEIFVMPIVSA